MGKPAWSKLWGASEHRDQLHSEAAGSFSSLHEGQNGNAAVIINAFIVCGAFCWTAIKAHKQTYSKMFWHPPQSPLWLALVVLWCQAVACCNWFWITRCHIVPSLPTPKYLFTPPPLVKPKRPPTPSQKTPWLSPCWKTDPQSTDWAKPQDKEARAWNTSSPQHQKKERTSSFPLLSQDRWEIVHFFSLTNLSMRACRGKILNYELAEKESGHNESHSESNTEQIRVSGADLRRFRTDCIICMWIGWRKKNKIKITKQDAFNLTTWLRLWLWNLVHPVCEALTYF